MAAPLIPDLDPRRIEAEIARVRERESPSFGGGMKANLFNLVVANLTGGQPDEALEVLLGRRPARIIRIEPAAAGPVGSAVSGRCFPGTLDRGVCLEQIDLSAAGDPLGSGAGAWTPLLARDIPTFLWIAGPWTPGADLPPLPGLEAAPGHPCPRRLPPLPGLEAAAHADKLIVDSSLADDPMAALASLHRLRQATHGRVAVADLAWSRTLPLRVQAARAFDPPGARESLAELAAVRLEGAARSEALLFFLWLASRLGWQASTVRAGPSFRDAAGRPVATVHEAPAPLARGARLSFDVRGAAGIGIACSPGDRPVRHPCRWPISAFHGYGCAAIGDDRGAWRIATDGELLLAEVDALKQDALLDEALAIAAAEDRGP